MELRAQLGTGKKTLVETRLDADVVVLTTHDKKRYVSCGNSKGLREYQGDPFCKANWTDIADGG